MKILVLDNYDSFTYNLVHILRALGHAPSIFRNDAIKVEEVKNYDKILLSPGPGIPNEAGIMKEVIKTYAPTKSILGVCLGHQGIAEVFGASLFNIPKVLHGVTSVSTITDKDDYLFKDFDNTFQSTHYHSWAVKPETIPSSMKVSAVNPEGLIMALYHTQFDVRGVQFHPESIMTPEGPRMIKNWLAH
ncbi:type 1 glutamine amidotransferase [Chryseotalea sanaruensis]|uniref:Type 1 glutamine amidotransferase n=1 Tax=Chryseotalea sanaruensis TaxID=2482724 RepID=A0A401U4W9_9BACT|nr:aminodeoxychorismate/anthranilate synthase component II [Chryseotalea sanaruensis]GCC49951.1 type 1 glutamine amidotransferase [Chryseotalea sanaruensis]